MNKKMHFRSLILTVVFLIFSVPCQAQFPQNHDESKVPPYTLPDLLSTADGRLITTAQEWEKSRRREIKAIFEKEVYGAVPEKEFSFDYAVQENAPGALDGIARRKQIRLNLSTVRGDLKIDLLIYLPAKTDQKVPVFVGYNFSGNQTIHTDPEIFLTDQWIRVREKQGILSNKATDETRGKLAYRWPVEKILERGYGLVTAYYGDVDPDFDDGFSNGVHPLFYRKSQTFPDSGEWGSISAWAWGLSRIVDYLMADDTIDARGIVVIGHSRLGKTALWAAAQDERFAMAISNNSGCGGAALSKRIFGETVAEINSSFPHWFCDNFNKYNDNESDLPVDQHMLLALIAPRPLYVASASEDLDADAKGEFLAAKEAEKVYGLYHKDGIGTGTMPEAGETFNRGCIGYHLRPGKHDITEYDWIRYMDFADRHLSRTEDN